LSDQLFVNYDAMAAAYAHTRRGSPRVVSDIVERCRNRPTHDILEIGCGTANHLLAVAASLGASGFGFDRSMSMLEQGRLKGEGLRLAQADAGLDLPFGQASFDLVFSVDFIHYLRDLPGIFPEVCRILRPGGVVVTVTESSEDLHNRSQSRYFPETVGVELQRYHPTSTIESAMRRSGLAEVLLTHTEHTVPVDESHLAIARNKTASSLRLIPEKSFQAGLALLTADLQRGCGIWNELRTYVWGVKPLVR
jgi:ubiquinone/menaquinone biosynthesis C-methylase UbiE